MGLLALRFGFIKVNSAKSQSQDRFAGVVRQGALAPHSVVPAGPKLCPNRIAKVAIKPMCLPRRRKPRPPKTRELESFVCGKVCRFCEGLKNGDDAEKS